MEKDELQDNCTLERGGGMKGTEIRGSWHGVPDLLIVTVIGLEKQDVR